jgi:hypothetical protein
MRASAQRVSVMCGPVSRAKERATVVCVIVRKVSRAQIAVVKFSPARLAAVGMASVGAVVFVSAIPVGRTLTARVRCFSVNQILTALVMVNARVVLVSVRKDGVVTAASVRRQCCALPILTGFSVVSKTQLAPVLEGAFARQVLNWIRMDLGFAIARRLAQLAVEPVRLWICTTVPSLSVPPCHRSLCLHKQWSNL